MLWENGAIGWLKKKARSLSPGLLSRSKPTTTMRQGTSETLFMSSHEYSELFVPKEVYAKISQATKEGERYSRLALWMLQKENKEMAAKMVRGSLLCQQEISRQLGNIEIEIKEEAAYE